MGFVYRGNALIKPNDSKVAGRVTLLREMLEMRPSEFAAFLGISRSRLSNIESGKLPLSRDMQFILVDKIDGLTLDYLFFGNTRFLTVDFAQRLEAARRRLNNG